MRQSLNAMIGVVGIVVATQAAAQVTVYSREDLSGRSFTTDRNVRNLERAGLDRSAASIAIQSGNWQVCDDADYSGHCIVLGPGDHRSLWDTGVDRIVSLRAVDERVGYGPPAAYGNTQPRMVADYDRRDGKRLYNAQVLDVHAVVGPPETRCWVERQQVVEENRGGPNVPGAIAGAVIGGILGHQIGSGRGNDVATAGGAVAGAAIGANVDRGRGGTTVSDRDVQRCTSVPSNAQPAYWDVTYAFRGVTHRMQLSSPPGATITVNGDGEPRV